MTALAVRKQVLDEILRILRKDLTFSVDPEDVKTCKPIDPANIVFLKTSKAERDIDPGKITNNLPGIFVTMPFEEDFPEDAGTNEHDEYRWRFLIQICDADTYQKEMNIATYLYWQELVDFAFQFHDMTESGNVNATRCLANAKAVQTVDERYWIKAKTFKTGVQLVIRTWLRRGQEAISGAI